MYSLKVLYFLLRFWEIDSPNCILLPLTFLIAAALHGFLRWGTKGRGRWLIVLFAAAVLACEVALHLIHTYTALLIVVVLYYSMAALLGTLLGEVLYQIWTNVHSK